MSGRASPGDASPSPAARRTGWRPKIRQATLIMPRTGERVRRVFTLHNTPNGTPDDSTPLLGGSARGRSSRSRFEYISAQVKKKGEEAYKFALSKTGLGILKCSLAYLLASMATFVVPVAETLGRNDSKHMVATVTVYFHPARSAGSMQEATIIALIAFLYAAFISFSSMGVSALFGHHNLITLGHVLVLIIFCGGGLGLVAWTKQRLGNPLVNVACSLASLSIITVLTKEGAVQAAKFSHEKVLQILKMVLMGICGTSLVSFIVLPVSARQSFRADLTRSTDLLSDFLTMITQAFLSGSDDEIKGPVFDSTVKQYRSSFNSLTKNLGESKWEHYFLGKEKEYKVYLQITKCIETIAQDMRGLKSAANIQFRVLESSMPSFKMGRSMSWGSVGKSTVTPAMTASGSSVTEDRPSILTSIHEEPEEEGVVDPSDEPHPKSAAPSIDHATAPSDIFAMFIEDLGAPMKSLAYTLKEVLGELPFDSQNRVNVNGHFRGSLNDACELYSTARKKGLAQLYSNNILTRRRSAEVAADFEEVAASCGYFSSSLQDLAEHMIQYVDVLEELKSLEDCAVTDRSWNWLMFWLRFKRAPVKTPQEEELTNRHASHEQNFTQNFPNPRRAATGLEGNIVTNQRTYRYRFWQALSFFRRQDVKFAVKVGVGAILFAMWSFIPSTRPAYSHWRLEWGLLSYMLVCSMTVGASNTTGFQRSWGTCAGALCAVLAWVVADDNPYILAFFGWLISLVCFYIILGVGKGPLGRYILLTYNLSALYSYSLSVSDEEDDEDEGGIDPHIWEIVLHRTVAVIVGVAWGMIITRLIWPISARKKLKDGLSLLWLRMGLIWKRDPLTILTEGLPDSNHMDIRESIELQRFLWSLQALREAATAEFDLRGAFPSQIFGRMLDTTGRILDSFYVMRAVILKDLKASPGEAKLLKYTKDERKQLSHRISHLFSVIASSMKLEYPMNDVLPDIEHTRDRLLAKIFQFRADATGEDAPTDQDYELLYSYTLVTGQMAEAIMAVSRDIEQLYGILDEDNLKLQ